VLNGLDMIAAFIRAKFPERNAELALAMADAPGRGREYHGRIRGTLLWRLSWERDGRGGSGVGVE